MAYDLVLGTVKIGRLPGYLRDFVQSGPLLFVANTMPRNNNKKKSSRKNASQPPRTSARSVAPAGGATTAAINRRPATRSRCAVEAAAASIRPTTRSQSNVTFDTPTVEPTDPSSTDIQRSDEGILKRNGIHPITGLEVSNCVCPWPTECRDIMWRYAEIGDAAMFPYFRLPRHPKKGDTPTGRHVIQLRGNIMHHLYGQDSNDIKDGMKGGGHKYISLLHFRPEIRPILTNCNESKKQNKWRVPLDVGKQCGLTKADETKVKDTYGNAPGTAFMPSPTVRLDEARLEIAEAERQYSIRRAAMNPTSHIDTGVQIGRKSPKERELDVLTREATANPRVVALRLQDREAENCALKKELADLKKKLDAREEAHKKEMGQLNDRLTSELLLTGLNRRSLLSNEYHEKKPWLSKHFFGKPWGEHKARGRAMFGRFVKDFNVDVTGEDTDIAPFEKYCMCCMIAWRGFTQPTVGAIYDRHRSQISRYMKVWMPLLGEAGADCSELDLEMNHNWINVDTLKENSLPYMHEGEAYGL